MKVLKPSFKILTKINSERMLKSIERAGRTCYKSESKITKESSIQFVKNIIARKHYSVLEHEFISVRIICDRGVSHEIVRHRIASFSQESTRYVCSIEKSKLKIENEEDVIKLYLDGLSMKKISDQSESKYNEWDIYKILEKNDVVIRAKGRRGVIDSNFFDKINTPEKAYLIAFIQCDGNIRKDDNQVTITQCEENEWFLFRMIKDLIQPNINSLSFSDKNIREQLIKKGVIPNKTYDQTEHHINLLWDSVPKKLKHDFLRGMIDGDGCIRWFKQNDRSLSHSCNISFCGNKFLMFKISEFLNEEYNYVAKVRQDSISECLYRVTITDSKVGYLFCSNLYKNFVFPYGHPKTSKWFNFINQEIPIKEWGSDKFGLIAPSVFQDKRCLWVWGSAMDKSEECYTKLIEMGESPQIARSVLPNSLKTEIVCTMNLRQWIHFFNLRALGTTGAPHPQMSEIAVPLLAEFQKRIPVIFDNLGGK